MNLFSQSHIFLKKEGKISRKQNREQETFTLRDKTGFHTHLKMLTQIETLALD